MLKSISMNYNETKNEYLKYRENLAIAERDTQRGNIMQIKPIDPLRLKPTKIKPDETIYIVMTPKRKKILFVRYYLKDFNTITVRGVVRKYKDAFRDTTESNKQLVEVFTVIMTDLIDMGVLRSYGSYRRKPTYSKIINPDKIEELRNE